MPDEQPDIARDDSHSDGETRPKSDRERVANPTSHDDEERAAAPEGESEAQLSRTQDRNQELLDGAEPGTEGESRIAGVHTETSGPPRSGDYAND